MRFIYIGEYPPSGVLQTWGCVFQPGEAVEVPEPFTARALNNRFFVEADDVKPAEKPSPAKPDAAPDGHHGFSKEELIAQADQFGVKIDKRWSADRIAAAIIAASQPQT